MTTPDNDRLFCREKAFAANPMLRASIPFVKPPHDERLLAMHALFASAELAVSTVSGQEVALPKLAWWLNEVGAAARSESHHPVMRELRRTGAADRLPWPRVSAWLGDAMARLDAAAPPTMDDLRSLCCNVGNPLVEMELAVSGASPADSDVYSDIAARRGLAQLVRETARQPDESRFWWVPLEVLARWGLARVELVRPGGDSNQRAVSQDIFERFIGKGESSFDILQNISDDKQKVINLFVLDIQICRKLENLKNNSPVTYGKTMNRQGFGDVLTGWKAARRFSRLK